MKSPRLGVIGAGRIAHFHVKAALKAGFVLDSVAASPKSERASSFAAEYGFHRFHENAEELISSASWDGLLICSTVESLLQLTTAASLDGRPILVEKPVTQCSAELTELLDRDPRHVFVAFNRRHYASIERALRFASGGGPAILEVGIPEIVTRREDESFAGYRSVFVNSVHVLDLVNFLVGPLAKDHTWRVGPRGASLSAVLSGMSSRGDVVIVKGNWNSPDNTYLSIERPGERLLLRPLERAQLFSGIEVLEPTEEWPLRRYFPQLVDETDSDWLSTDFKPGFLSQMLDFKRFIQKGQLSHRMAFIRDAQVALSMAEKLVGIPPNV